MAFRNTDASWVAFSEMFRAFCIGLDTPRSLAAWLMFSNNEFAQLASMKVHPLEYCTADSFAADYSVVSFLKKNADLPKVCDTRAAAITAFARSEEQCRMTNERFEAWMSGQFFITDRSVVEVLHLAQRKISVLLADHASCDTGPYSWGPGATFDLPRRRAYPDTKLVELPLTVTGSAWKHAARAIASDLHWKEAIVHANPDYSGPVFQVIPGGRYDTVPKTVLTDRSILVEPRLNSFLQKQVGAQIRARLKRVGVDLDDQSKNQYLAEHAMALGLATLDLEAASDTVSVSVVRYLLPPDWFDLLDDLRSKMVLTDQGWVRLEKFSSMGNGFTFELESMIFWAITAAVTELGGYSLLGIYGDDIVARKEVCPSLVGALSFCGFVLNQTKSFLDGVFYESCGKHYFGGHDVTPIYQKEIPTDGPSAARLGNRLLRFAARLGIHHSFDKRLRGAWEQWRRSNDIPPDQLGPYVGTGDGYWEAPASYLSNRSRRGVIHPEFKVVCYGVRKQEIPANDDAMYALWLQRTTGIQPVFERDSRLRRNTYPRGEPTVSITGSARALKVSSLTAEIGMLTSRLKPRHVKQHRWVHSGPYSTALDW